MTAFPLFDLFSAASDATHTGNEKQEREGQLLKVAATMVSLAVQQFEKIRELDEAIASPSELAFDMDAAVALRLMYEDAANDAERILTRIDRLERRNACVISGSGTLRDLHGKTMAMLSVPLEETVLGIEQANHGDLISATDMRNELLSRLHH